MKFVSALAIGFIMTASAFATETRVESYDVLRDSAELHAAHSQVKIADARFAMLPTKVEITRGYCPGQDRWENCFETTVLERLAVVQVTVEYKDGIFPGSTTGRRTERGIVSMNLNLPIDSFEASEVESLKSASGIFGNFGVRQAFINNNLKLSNVRTLKTIQVVDVKNSKLCSVRQQDSGLCTEVLVYKPMNITVQKIKVSVK
jgi:hypothetical protein